MSERNKPTKKQDQKKWREKTRKKLRLSKKTKDKQPSIQRR